MGELGQPGLVVQVGQRDGAGRAVGSRRFEKVSVARVVQRAHDVHAVPRVVLVHFRTRDVRLELRDELACDEHQVAGRSTLEDRRSKLDHRFGFQPRKQVRDAPDIGRGRSGGHRGRRPSHRVTCATRARWRSRAARRTRGGRRGRSGALGLWLHQAVDLKVVIRHEAKVLRVPAEQGTRFERQARGVRLLAPTEPDGIRLRIPDERDALAVRVVVVRVIASDVTHGSGSSRAGCDCSRPLTLVCLTARWRRRRTGPLRRRR